MLRRNFLNPQTVTGFSYEIGIECTQKEASECTRKEAGLDGNNPAAADITNWIAQPTLRLANLKGPVSWSEIRVNGLTRTWKSRQNHGE